MIASLREDSLQPEVSEEDFEIVVSFDLKPFFLSHQVLLSNLEYIGEVLGVLAARAE